jgi:hypothetical protein
MVQVSTMFETLDIPSETLPKAALSMSIHFPNIWLPSAGIWDRHSTRKAVSHEV